ncbi:MAG: hypothetical protein ABI353_08690, partial [Isosphaeraceae bacterium]
GNDVDFFKFTGKKGQRIVVDAQCARIGSGVDPMIRLTTASRGFVASADDTAGLLTDARLTAVLPEDTDYVVEISDSRYQGGGRPVYRLVIGPLPVADEVYPLGGRRGETVGFELRGGTLTELRTASATLNAPLGTEEYRLQVSGAALGFDPALELELTRPIEVSDLLELREPADPNAPPVKADAPVAFNGRIDPVGDEDRLIVTVTPGQAYHIQVSAADLGSALDGTLQVLKGDGAQLATADDTTTAPASKKAQQKKAAGTISPDPSLSFTPPAGVTEITLVLRDLENRGGPGFPYRLTVEPATPSFNVALNDGQVSIPKGGTATLGLTVTRLGYNGPITLSVLEPPPGLTVRPGLIPDGQTVGALSISASADATFGPLDLKVIGTGQGPNGPIVEHATKTTVYAQQATLATNSQTQAGLTATTALPRPLTLDTPAEPVEVVHGFGAPIPIKVERKEGGEGKLTVAPLPLPTGLTVPNAEVADKAAEATATVNAAPEAALGATTIGLTAKGKIGGKDQVLSIPAVALNIVRPADLTLTAPAIEIKPGATVDVTGKVVRKGAFKDPVTIKLNGLPAGLKAEPVTVAPEASDFTIKVVADAKAADASANAQAAMAFQINKKDYVTPPTPLAVKVAK